MMIDALTRALLRLYPEPFRRRFGRELLQIWRAEGDEARAAGRLAAARHWTSWCFVTLYDALLRHLRPDPSRPSVPADRGALFTLDWIRRDAAFALRSLGRRPVWTLSVAGTLALGLGASIAIFSVVHDSLLRPLPFDDAASLVVVEALAPESRRSILASYPAYRSYRDAQEGLEGLDAWTTQHATVDLGDGPSRRWTATASSGLLRTLRVDPFLGRGFTAEDDRVGQAPVALISHRLWAEEMGRLSKGRGGAGDDGILGRTITVDEVQHTVVGVLPPGLAYPDGEVDLWLPLGGAPRGRGFYYLSMLGRLEDGVTPQQLTARFAAFGPTMPNGPVDSPIDLVATPMRENLVGDLRPQLSLFLAAVATVLLIACLNATHLILIRALGRRRELALRAALGAGRGPLLRQLVVEGCALGLLGGILGTALAFGILEGLRSLGPEWMPRPEELGLDGTALAFAFGLSLALGALLGAATAVRATADDPSLGMTGARGEVGGGQRSRAALIVVQLAGAVVLLSTALLLVSSYRSIESRESGFDPGGTLMVDLDLPAGRYGTRQEQGAYYAQLLEELRSLPGVTAAAVASSHPFTFYINHGIELDGGQDESNLASRVRLVSDGYPETTGLTVLEGRFVEERDGWNAVVVNATLARRLAPGGSAVGLRIKLRNIEPETWRTVVGVVADVEHYGRLAHWQHAMYVPAQGVPYPHPMTPILRTEGDPLALGPSIRERILAVDPRVPAGALVPLDDLLWRSKSEPRLRTTLLGGFGALALVLAMTGLYGVMAFWVADRGKEFGVRQALGANRAGIVGMVLLHALGRVGLGVGLGLALTWPALALVRHQIPDLAPAEPTLQGTAVLLLALTALLACWIPARRAAGVDPITALREE